MKTQDEWLAEVEAIAFDREIRPPERLKALSMYADAKKYWNAFEDDRLEKVKAILSTVDSAF